MSDFQIFFYNYGCMGHIYKDCKTLVDSNEMQYGDQLRVSGDKTVQLRDQVECEKKLKVLTELLHGLATGSSCDNRKPYSLVCLQEGKRKSMHKFTLQSIIKKLNLGQKDDNSRSPTLDVSILIVDTFINSPACIFVHEQYIIHIGISNGYNIR